MVQQFGHIFLMCSDCCDIMYISYIILLRHNYVLMRWGLLDGVLYKFCSIFDGVQ
jgi:hypothetical protein